MLFPGLDKPPDKPPQLLGYRRHAVNLALRKKVTSSDSNPVLGSCLFVTDGRRKEPNPTSLELDLCNNGVQIDLEKPCRLYAVYVWAFLP